MVFNFLARIFCSHGETLTKTNGNHLYTECLKCGHTSPGVSTGGHSYGRVAPCFFVFSGNNPVPRVVPR